MAKHLPILFILLVFPFQPVMTQDPVKTDNLRKIIRENGQAEVTIALPGRSALEFIGSNVSIASIHDKKVHIILSELTVDWFLNKKYPFEIVGRSSAKSILNSSDMSQAMEWNSYPSYSQYDSIMQFFASEYPSLCSLDTIGTSIYGKMVLALKISDNVSDDEDEPEVFYSSSIHGDETGGFILMLRLIDHLLKNYPVNGRIQHLVSNLEIWINPLANPDGMYRNGNLIINPVRWNASGTDLNRNFPDPEEPGIIQQKENTDMINFMRRRRFIISANFHSGAEVVNYPWDSRSQLHADDEWFRFISRKYADTAHAHSIPIYMTDLDNGITRGISWYKINGGRQDFVTYELRGREVTIELDNDFITPANELENLWNYNRNSLIGYLENALYGIHGKVTDLKTSKPLPARIFIRGHDADNSHILADSLTGRFVRMLSPGSWDITVTAKGYRDTVIRQVLLDRDHRTDLQIGMIPSVMDAPLLYPNPASTILKTDLPPGMSGRINLLVISSSGVRILDYYTDFSPGIPVELDVSRMASGVYTIRLTSVLTGVTVEGRFVVIRR